MKLKFFDLRTEVLLLWLLLSTSSVADSPTSFTLKDFPAPPEPIQQWLDLGPLTWESGPRERNQRLIGNQRQVAETTYRIKYSYNCRTRWIVDRAAGTVTIKIRYVHILWSSAHHIWLETLPDPDRIWSDPIVLHELDHLRISSDPQLAIRFEQRLREQPVLIRSLDSDQVVDQGLVDRWIQQHVVGIFQEYSDLIAIRYKELDRVTSHGQQPVPQDSEIARLLDN